MIYLLIIIVSFVLLGMLSGSEVGFARASRLNIEIKKKQGRRSAKILSNYLDKPDEYIAAGVVGSSILLVVLCLSFTNLDLFSNFPKLEILQNTWVQFILLSVNITLLVLLFGKLIPKSLFKSGGDTMLYIVSLPVKGFVYIMAPIALGIKHIAEFTIKYLFNVDTVQHKKIFTRPDLENFIRRLKTGKDDSNREEVNTTLFENALQLSRVRIRECLIPRNEIIAVDRDASFDEIKKTIIETKHSKVIVFDKDIDNIIGYVHHLDFYGQEQKLQDIIHTISAVPETMNAVELLNQFNQNRKSIAWVVDEFGGTAGIVSMEDILEELFGEIEDEHDEQEYIEKQLSKDEYIFSGRLEVEYINEKFDLQIPTELAETISGYIIEEHNAIPKQKEKILLGKYEFDVLLVSQTRIETVKLKVLDNE